MACTRAPPLAYRTLRLALFVLAVARASAPVAATRVLQSALEPASLCCLEVQLHSPFFEAGKPPKPGTRFDSAKAHVMGCAPVAACGGEASSLVPTAAVSGGAATDDDPFALTMRLLVPARGPARSWPDEGPERGPPPEALLPPGSWTHFAGDSLLRGVFSTLTQYLKQARWEQWQGAAASAAAAARQHVLRTQDASRALRSFASLPFARAGEAYFQSVFHMGRSLCCANVSRADSCVFALHNESSATFLSSTRDALREGRACVTYSFLMHYAAITDQMKQMTSSQGAVPTRLVTSAALHTMKSRNASYYKADVAAFLAEAATPPWSNTVVAMHAAAAPNYSMVAAAGHKQTPAAVSSFNAALREAVSDVAKARGDAAAPRLVDLHGITHEGGGAQGAAGAMRRFPRLDALHFHDAFYQTAFVADALALDAAQRIRDATKR